MPVQYRRVQVSTCQDSRCSDRSTDCWQTHWHTALTWGVRRVGPVLSIREPSFAGMCMDRTWADDCGVGVRGRSGSPGLMPPIVYAASWALLYCFAQVQVSGATVALRHPHDILRGTVIPPGTFFNVHTHLLPIYPDHIPGSRRIPDQTFNYIVAMVISRRSCLSSRGRAPENSEVAPGPASAVTGSGRSSMLSTAAKTSVLSQFVYLGSGFDPHRWHFRWWVSR